MMSYTTAEQDAILAEFEDSQAIKQQLLEMWLAYTDNALETFSRFQTLLFSWKTLPCDIPEDVFVAGWEELGNANLLEWADSCPISEKSVDFLRQAVTGKEVSHEPS